MPLSDSEDFESADEGPPSDKKERKTRLSSSNYSDDAPELESETKDTPKDGFKSQPKPAQQTADGWNNIEEEEILSTTVFDKTKEVTKKPTIVIDEVKSQDTGWDDFDDWGEEETVQKNIPEREQPHQVKSKEPEVKPNPVSSPVQSKNQDEDIKSVTDRLAAASVKSSGWGWGWGVDSILNTATAGISTITNQVSQGISTVLESGIGAPNPEDLARQHAADVDTDSQIPKNSSEQMERTQQGPSGDATFQFGSILSGVTKFVESTSTKVIAGGLDTLETIGKKTMEVLQDGDPGLAKKRAMLGLDSGDKPVLSQILREAKAKADEEDKIREDKREAKEVHYENLFDDFEGLVHLEALEMLSKQVSMRIDERIRGLGPEKRQDVKETLQQVAELCEIPEDEDDDDEEASEDQSKPDHLQARLQNSTQDLGLKLQFQPLVKQYSELLQWLSTDSTTDKSVYKRAVGALAQATALSVEIYHKAAEMLLVKTRRSTADEADALTQMTVVLTKHVSDLATLFTTKLNSIDTENKEQITTYTTNIFLESGNSSTYIQNAFQLTLPILQIGAV